MRSFLILLLTLPVGFTNHADGAAPTKPSSRKSPWSAAVEKARRAIVTIQRTAPDQEQPETRAAGVIVDPNGTVIASYQDDHDMREAILADGSKLPLMVIRADRKVGVTIFKVVTNRPLPHLPLANSDKVAVGDSAVVFSFAWKSDSVPIPHVVIVSATHKKLADRKEMLQLETSCLGFRSGPVIDLQGNLLGFVPSERIEGLGYALPSNSLRRLWRKQ